jgi:hypothetical protein
MAGFRGVAVAGSRSEPATAGGDAAKRAQVVCGVPLEEA